MSELTLPVNAGTPVSKPTRSTDESTRPGGALGKDEFLQLLMAQIRNQDPMNPTDSTASIAQLAQFSALEQMTNVGTEVAGLRRQDAMLQSMLLQGRQVTGTTDAGAEVQGLIEKVTWDDVDGMMLRINQVNYPMNKFSNISLYDATLSSGTTASAVETPVTGETTQPVI